MVAVKGKSQYTLVGKQQSRYVKEANSQNLNMIKTRGLWYQQNKYAARRNFKCVANRHDTKQMETHGNERNTRLKLSTTMEVL